MIVIIHLLNALASGMLLALTALGLTMIFGFLKVINFAHGAIYMLGAYFAFTIVTTLHSFWLGLILAPILVGAIGLLLERFWLRKLENKDIVYSMLLTFGLALIIENVVKMVWGSSNYSYDGPAFLQGSVEIAGYPFPSYRLFVILFSALVCLALYLILHRTKIGIRVRAGTEDGEMALALGINTKTLGMWVFGAGCALAAIAGVVAGPYLTLTPDMGGSIIITTFIVIVIGGMGNLLGVIVSALLIGFIQTIGSIFMPEFAMVFVYLAMIIVLIINDKGILALFKRA